MSAPFSGRNGRKGVQTVRKSILAAALAVCLLLSGCAALLERSYSVVEPYAQRYWESGAEDTLRVDSYQDLVNSLVMLIEQRVEEAVIRCYGEVGTYTQASKAQREVRRDTVEGSYLLESIRFTFGEGTNYSTVDFHMTYREDAEDLAGIMTLTDSQSLVDLLRLAIREEHEKITAKFTFDTPREAVQTAVEGYWQELCREELAAEAAETEAAAALETAETEETDVPPGEEESEGSEPALEEAEATEPVEETEEPVSEPPPEEGPAETVSGVPDGEEEEPIDYPPCPWVMRFYPGQGTAELVEILLKE